jgi:hypothetical protein
VVVRSRDHVVVGAAGVHHRPSAAVVNALVQGKGDEGVIGAGAAAVLFVLAVGEVRYLKSQISSIRTINNIKRTLTHP